jgi:hypothetical protein
MFLQLFLDGHQISINMGEVHFDIIHAHRGTNAYDGDDDDNDGDDNDGDDNGDDNAGDDYDDDNADEIYI